MVAVRKAMNDYCCSLYTRIKRPCNRFCVIARFKYHRPSGLQIANRYRPFLLFCFFDIAYRANIRGYKMQHKFCCYYRWCRLVYIRLYQFVTRLYHLMCYRLNYNIFRAIIHVFNFNKRVISFAGKFISS